MITLVTSKAYIIAERVNFVTLQIAVDDYRNLKDTERLYDIVIEYVPITYNSNGSAHPENVAIRVRGEKTAHDLIKAMVSQIREQCPDQLYLDKVAEKFLAGELDVLDEDIPAVKKSKSIRDKAAYRSKGKQHRNNIKRKRSSSFAKRKRVRR